ncbi:hypothetical protein AB0B50_33020 [Streptomyces sp. NPDC041068]|uniref:hypothetical protein n=1 Tax=Streptomyces sp. NPDC041068 TaxID=3155130 RepID=UPI0033E2200D
MNLLLLGRRTAMGALAALLLAAGVWASWDTAQHVMLTQGRERGVLTVTRCGSDECVGWFASSSRGADSRQRVEIERSIAERKGARIPVALKPGTRDAVRTGGPGFLHAWLPLGGALLLASVVVAGGLRLPRTAWGMALAGGSLLTASFVTLTF